MRKLVLAAMAASFLTVPVAAQSALGPPGWSDLDVVAGSVAYWINGERLCNIDYDPVAREARTREFAEIHGLSVSAVKREALKMADRFAPNVTPDTCRNATQQAKRLGILAGYRPPRDFPPTPESLSD